jgi:hypothetical protein
MFIAALITIAKLCKCPNEWIKKIWCVCTTENYLAIKKNAIIFFVGNWMELKITMLGEVSQVQKDKSSMFSLICGS